MSCVLIELVSRDKDCDSGNRHRVAGDTSLTPRSSPQSREVGDLRTCVRERVQARCRIPCLVTAGQAEVNQPWGVCVWSSVRHRALKSKCKGECVEHGPPCFRKATS